MRDFPSIEPTGRMLDATAEITAEADSRESADIDDSSLQAAAYIVRAAGEKAVHVGTAGREARPPFVNVAPLDPVTIGEANAVEDYGRQLPVVQVSVFRSSAASASLRRRQLLVEFSRANDKNRWQLRDSEIPPFEDDTLHPPAWVAPFGVMDLWKPTT